MLTKNALPFLCAAFLLGMGAAVVDNQSQSDAMLVGSVTCMGAGAIASIIELIKDDKQ